MLDLSNQNDRTATKSTRSNNLKDTSKFRKLSFNCFGNLCCSRKKVEEEIEIDFGLFEDQKMFNPFKSNKNESKSSSSNSLSANQLIIKPIKSLSSNATGSGRTKVEIKPGHSLMDWIRLTNSGADLTCNSFGSRKVTGAELAKHNKIDDAWTSIQGNVFNITPYFEYHPGGVVELLRAAGKESTQLFKQVHAWVNWSSLLAKCKVGDLIPGDDVKYAELDKVEEIEVKKVVEEKKSTKDVNSSSVYSLNDELFDKNLVVLEETESLYNMDLERKYELDKPVINLNEFQTIDNQFKTSYWYENLEEFYVCFKFEKAVKEEDLLIDLTEERVFKVKIYLTNRVCYILNCRLPSLIKQEINFFFLENNKLLTIMCKKLIQELWAGILNSNSYKFELTNQTNLNTFFRKVKLIEKINLTHDVYQFAFKIPDGLFIPVRYGSHLALRLNFNNEPIFRFYTLVPHWFLNIEDDSTEPFEIKDIFRFIIKIYKDGEFTSNLNKLKIGYKIDLSDCFTVDCDLQKILTTRETIYLLAAGTGITPMLSILYLCKLFSNQQEVTKKVKEIKLIFCNKTEKDIILKDKLNELAEQKLGFKFSCINILSRPESNWNGIKGRINKEIIREQTKLDENEFLFLCGPDEFNLSILNILDSLYHLKDETYYIFSS